MLMFVYSSCTVFDRRISRCAFIGLFVVAVSLVAWFTS